MDTNWWKEAIIYQIYPKSFYDSNQDGIGDLQGIVEKLPYLKELGIDAVWISPFFKSPMKDNGYDISDYYDIDPMFGTMEDMDRLLGEAAQLEIKIMIDLVLNHSSNEHPWFQAALRDKHSPFRDYYIFKEKKKGKMPTNWRSIFGGSAWEEVADGSCYLHTFDKSQPDLNWENPKLRSELYSMINFWIDKGVGGFRIDAITFIKKNQEFSSLPADQNDQLVNIAKATLNQDGIHDFLQEMKRETYGHDGLVTVAEAPGVPYEELDQYIGDTGAFSMIFDFSYADLDINENGSWYPKKTWSFNELRTAIFKSQISVQKAGWAALYLESHDQPRSIDKYFGVQSSISELDNYLKGTLLATMYFLLRGTPFIYQGQELGMRNADFKSIDLYDDLSTKDQYMRALKLGATRKEAMEIVGQRSRDHARTPMQWHDEPYAGFSQTKPWLLVNQNYPLINVERLKNSSNSIFRFYKQLIELRKTSKYKQVLVYGDIFPMFDHIDNIIAYRRTLKGQKEIAVITNFSTHEVILELDYSRVIVSNYGEVYVEKNESVYHLKALEAVVLER